MHRNALRLRLSKNEIQNGGFARLEFVATSPKSSLAQRRWATRWGGGCCWGGRICTLTKTALYQWLLESFVDPTHESSPISLVKQSNIPADILIRYQRIRITDKSNLLFSREFALVKPHRYYFWEVSYKKSARLPKQSSHFFRSSHNRLSNLDRILDEVNDRVGLNHLLIS